MHLHAWAALFIAIESVASLSVCSDSTVLLTTDNVRRKVIKMKRQIEILAPAGSYDGMRAAMNAGCDAVYIGGSSFGARAYANNPETETLLKAIDEAHIRGKKLYLTVNTLLKEKELDEMLHKYLEPYYLQGLDAVIVQDVGVMHYIHQHFPKLPIHASTQMTLTMAQGANLLRDYGVTRLVTSRELSLKEISELNKNTELEIETFVHGALCYCYSGQCLMSSVIGGRSGNRGRCAQPCRMPYQFYSGDKKISSGQEKYLLSPKDINTVAIIPELVEAGIDSFKIEGRMKRPEYAAAVSQIYRKYIDLYFELGKADYQEYIKGNDFTKDIIQLQDVFNRGGFSQGYAKTYNNKNMMSLERPNHSGVYIGEVTSVKGSQVSIKLCETVNAQDVLEIREREEAGYEFTVKASLVKGEILTTNVGRRPFPKGDEASKQESRYKAGKNKDAKLGRYLAPTINVGDKVYRTKNNALLTHLAAKYLDKESQLGIRGNIRARIGEKLSLTVSYQNISITAYNEEVQEALKQPMTKEKLLAPLVKTGDTFYYFDELEADMDSNLFVPVAWLNEIRRDALRKLQEEVTLVYRRSQEKSANPEAVQERIAPEVKHNSFGVCVTVSTKEQFDTALDFENITSVNVQFDTFEPEELLVMAKKAKAGGKDFYLMLPHICRQSVYQNLEKDITSMLAEEEISGFIVKNFEEIALLKTLLGNKENPPEIILNHNMYVYNKEAKNFWNEMGITYFTAPVELNYAELKRLKVSDCDFIVYGYLPLMVSAQCLYESTAGCIKCKTGEQGQAGYLIDRMGKKFFVQTNCKGCYNTIYNGQCLSLLKNANEVIGLSPRNIRLDFTIETKEEMRQVIISFLAVYLDRRESELQLQNLTTGHFKRGVE
jgi:putative protease